MIDIRLGINVKKWNLIARSAKTIVVESERRRETQKKVGPSSTKGTDPKAVFWQSWRIIKPRMNDRAQFWFSCVRRVQPASQERGKPKRAARSSRVARVPQMLGLS